MFPEFVTAFSIPDVEPIEMSPFLTLTSVTPERGEMHFIKVRWIMRSAECGVRSVENAECGKCGVWKMRSVENAECGKCGVWKMRSVENAECGKCGVWKMRRKFQFSVFFSNLIKT